MTLAHVLLLALSTGLLGCGEVPLQKRAERYFERSDRARSADANVAPIPDYEFFHGRWTSFPISIRTDSVMDKKMVNAIRNAASTWNDAVGFELLEISDDRSDFSTIRSFNDALADGVNSIGLVDNWRRTYKTPAVIGTTVWSNDEGKVSGPWGETNVITGGDIVLNRQCYDWVDSLEGPHQSAIVTVDTESVILHELGHLIGLEHTRDRTAVMYPNIYIGDGLASRSLSTGDVQRIRFLYVPDAPPPDAIEPPHNAPSASPTPRANDPEPSTAPGCRTFPRDIDTFRN